MKRMFVRKNYGAYVDLDSVKVEVYYGDICKYHFEDAANSHSTMANPGGQLGITWLHLPVHLHLLPILPPHPMQEVPLPPLRMANPIDLTTAEKSNTDLLNARWSIEKGYDYGSVYAYTLAGILFSLWEIYIRVQLDQRQAIQFTMAFRNTGYRSDRSLCAFEGEPQLYIDFQIVSDGFRNGWLVHWWCGCDIF